MKLSTIGAVVGRESSKAAEHERLSRRDHADAICAMSYELRVAAAQRWARARYWEEACRNLLRTINSPCPPSRAVIQVGLLVIKEHRASYYDVGREI